MSLHWKRNLPNRCRTQSVLPESRLYQRQLDRFDTADPVIRRFADASAPLSLRICNHVRSYATPSYADGCYREMARLTIGMVQTQPTLTRMRRHCDVIQLGFTDLVQIDDVGETGPNRYGYLVD